LKTSRTGNTIFTARILEGKINSYDTVSAYGSVYPDKDGIPRMSVLKDAVAGKVAVAPLAVAINKITVQTGGNGAQNISIVKNEGLLELSELMPRPVTALEIEDLRNGSQCIVVDSSMADGYGNIDAVGYVDL